MDALVNRANRVPEMQRKLQSDPRFIHQKMPRAKLYWRGFMLFFIPGLCGALYGATSMARGVNKVPKKDAA